MSPALPHTGGAYSFARYAMGPWGGYVTGLAENMAFILTPAVIVVGIGSYLGTIFGTPEWAEPLWWLCAYVAFVGLNIWGVEVSFRFTVLVTFLALGTLVVFWLGAVGHFDFDRYALDIVPEGEGATRWLPRGWMGVLGALPFAIWFFLAIEELPLAAEEAHDPKRDMPRAMMLGLGTLVVAAFLTLFLNSGIAPGAAALSTADEPILTGFQTILGDGIGGQVLARILALVAVTGLVASFHAIIFAYGRQIYSLSRAGYFPRVLSLTHSTRKTPHIALIAGAAIGYAVALVLHYVPKEHPVGAMLLNMAVFGAVLSYMLQTASFILLRVRAPGLERPYRSPLGVPGAVLAFAIALLTFGALFVTEPGYRWAVAGAAGWYVLGHAYFAFYARRRLVYSPEESAADGRAGTT
jgi:ethanolamine permease